MKNTVVLFYFVHTEVGKRVEEENQRQKKVPFSTTTTIVVVAWLAPAAPTYSASL